MKNVKNVKNKKDSETYRIIDGWLKSKGCPERSGINPKTGIPYEAHWLIFEGDRKTVYEWLVEGMMCTEGAERDHYVDMMEQLELGQTLLDYRRNG